MSYLVLKPLLTLICIGSAAMYCVGEIMGMFGSQVRRHILAPLRVLIAPFTGYVSNGRDYHYSTQVIQNVVQCSHIFCPQVVN